MKIRQAHVSESLPYFRGKFHRRFDLLEYTDPDKPVVFLGCDVTYHGLDKMLENKALVVLVWGGSDAKRLVDDPEIYKEVRAPHIVHVAQSSFIAEDLKRAGLAYKYVPVNTATVSKFPPCRLGDMVYAYLPPDQDEKYGGPLLRGVMRRLPEVQFLVTKGCNHVVHRDMRVVYSLCRLGLRLTRHDGMAHTVTEMGLAGRMCVWNGESPNALPWSSIDDVVRHVKESFNAASSPQEVSSRMWRFLNVGDDWLRTEFYE